MASIRRIIADDQEGVQTASPAKSPLALAPVPPLDEDDVLDLAEIAPPRAKAPPPVPLDLDAPEVAFRDDEGAVPGFGRIERGEEPEPVPDRPPPPRREPPPIPRRAEPPPASNEDHLISAATDATVGQAFNLLANTVLGSNTRTLEDLVREMLRPLLKNWLDDNLPTIVERLVRAEIERVARGK